MRRTIGPFGGFEGDNDVSSQIGQLNSERT